MATFCFDEYDHLLQFKTGPGSRPVQPFTTRPWQRNGNNTLIIAIEVKGSLFNRTLYIVSVSLT